MADPRREHQEFLDWLIPSSGRPDPGQPSGSGGRSGEGVAPSDSPVVYPQWTRNLGAIHRWLQQQREQNLLTMRDRGIYSPENQAVDTMQQVATDVVAPAVGYLQEQLADPVVQSWLEPLNWPSQFVGGMVAGQNPIESFKNTYGAHPEMRWDEELGREVPVQPTLSEALIERGVNPWLAFSSELVIPDGIPLGKPADLVPLLGLAGRWSGWAKIFGEDVATAFTRGLADSSTASPLANRIYDLITSPGSVRYKMPELNDPNMMRQAADEANDLLRHSPGWVQESMEAQARAVAFDAARQPVDMNSGWARALQEARSSQERLNILAEMGNQDLLLPITGRGPALHELAMEAVDLRIDRVSDVSALYTYDGVLDPSIVRFLEAIIPLGGGKGSVASEALQAARFGPVSTTSATGNPRQTLLADLNALSGSIIAESGAWRVFSELAPLRSAAELSESGITDDVLIGLWSKLEKAGKQLEALQAIMGQHEYRYMASRGLLGEAQDMLLEADRVFNEAGNGLIAAYERGVERAASNQMFNTAFVDEVPLTDLPSSAISEIQRRLNDLLGR